MDNTASRIGVIGEKAATKYLRQNGFLIHDLNWRAGRYEIDIVAERWGVIHFVEVKSRRRSGMSRPEEAMTKDKCAALTKAARAYIAQHHTREESQFDLIAVDVDEDGTLELRHIEHVMEFHW